MPLIWHLYCKCSCMSNLDVKTSTCLTRLMQLLCLLFLGYSHCFAQFASVANGSAANAATTSNSQANLAIMTQQISQWYSKIYGINPKEVVLGALDPRLQVSSCAKPLAIDNPFASRETVRVRCSEPVWQLYVQVNLAGINPQAVISPSNSLVSTSTPSSNSIPNSRTVVVPIRYLQRGTVLQAEWLEVVQAPSGPVDTTLLGAITDAQQSELIRDVPAGQPIKSSDIRKAILVRQGQTVLLSVGDKVGYQITVRAESLQDGRLGDQVKLKNAESGRQISGVVTGPNTAKGL